MGLVFKAVFSVAKCISKGWFSGYKVRCSNGREVRTFDGAFRLRMDLVFKAKFRLRGASPEVWISRLRGMASGGWRSGYRVRRSNGREVRTFDGAFRLRMDLVFKAKFRLRGASPEVWVSRLRGMASGGWRSGYRVRCSNGRKVRTFDGVFGCGWAKSPAVRWSSGYGRMRTQVGPVGVSRIERGKQDRLE